MRFGKRATRRRIPFVRPRGTLLLAVILYAHHARILLLLPTEVGGREADAIDVAEEQDVLVLALGTFIRLHPLARPRVLVQGPNEAERATLDIASIVLAHDGLDGLGRFVGVVEGDGGDVVVQDVRLDDAVEKAAADEAELAVNGSRGAAGKVPGRASVVGKSRVGVLEVGDRD